MRFVVPVLEDPGSHSKAVRREVARRQQEIREAFRAHNERIRPLLPPGLQLVQDTPLDDAEVRSLRIDPAQKTLRLCLEVGDAQRGMADLCLEFNGMELTEQDFSLLCLLAHNEHTEVCQEEIDVEQDADGSTVFVLRLLWHTGVRIGRTPMGGDMGIIHMLMPETEFRFHTLEAQITAHGDTPRSPFRRPNDFITVVGVSGDPDWVRDWQPTAPGEDR